MKTNQNLLATGLTVGMTALFGLASSNASAYTLTTFGPAAWNADTTVQDAALGITGADIYNFDAGAAGANLIPNVSVTGLDTNITPAGGPTGFAWDTESVTITTTNAGSSVSFSFTDGT